MRGSRNVPTSVKNNVWRSRGLKDGPGIPVAALVTPFWACTLPALAGISGVPRGQARGMTIQ